MDRQRCKAPQRVGVMCVVFAVACVWTGNVPGWNSSSETTSDLASTPLAPARSLHGDASNNTSAEDYECYGGLTYDEQYEQDVIGPFQVLTQRKYMLTIYGCAVEGHPICLRPEYHWMIAVYLVGLLYMFAGLAIICDEFFVPALELFTGELGISEDVAGATFMAAGGSMPELFTSFIGTFNESDVGFAAIIGSAVFNVLFVIAVCTLASDQPLELTWWPLFRDVMWYLLALSLVGFVFKATSPNEIELWEAALLLCCYASYATFMKFNPQIHAWVEKKTGGSKEGGEGDSLKDGKDGEKAPDEVVSPNEANFAKPSTFRVGIFQLLTQNASVSETAGIHAVTKIKGTLQETFTKFDTNGNGRLCEEEVMLMLNEFGLKDHGPAIQQQLKNIEPRDASGDITFDAFTKWYIASEVRVAVEIHSVFKKFDTDNSGTIDRKEIGELLSDLGHRPTDEEVQKALEEMRNIDAEVAGSDSDAVRPVSSPSNEGADEGIKLEQFEKWYQQSMFWKKHHQDHVNQDNVESGGFDISWPEGAKGAQLGWFLFTYPIAAMMYCTMPDVRREGKGTFRMAILEFACSLMWIAFLSLCLYDWLVVVCNTIGFPPEVAAVTVLAGGTSIPDLLSSYVVAKKGEGDMAVSSSIGSNIFDVTVGLPLPWLFFNIINGRRVEVMSGSLFSSILILILMLIGVIVTVMAMKWKMTKSLGGVMMGLYVLFIVQQLLQDFDVINYGI